MKHKIYEDEYYPYYEINDDTRGIYEEIDLTEEELKFVNDTMSAFVKVQLLLKSKFNEASCLVDVRK